MRRSATRRASSLRLESEGPLLGGMGFAPQLIYHLYSRSFQAFEMVR
jgi:hypothetical protein